MALSYIEFYGNGVQTNFSFSSIQLLDDDLVTIGSQLKIYKNSVLLTQGVDYSVNIVTENIQFGSAPLSTDYIRISRSTKSDERYVDYTNSTNVTAELLNTDALQLFFLAQEAKDVQTDAMVVGPDGKWDGQGRIVGNILPGVAGTDAVSVAQLESATLGVTPASVGGHGYQLYTGNGTETTFQLPAQISTFTDPSDVAIYINGVYQSPSTAYSIVTGNVVFTSAPPASSSVEFLWLQGVLAGILGADAVSTSALINNAVTVAKMSSGAATAGQVYQANGTGGVTIGNILPAVITGFDAAVRASRLDQMAAPTAAVSMNSQRLTNVGTPTATTDPLRFDDLIGQKCISICFTNSGVTGNVTGSDGTVWNVTNTGSLISFQGPAGTLWTGAVVAYGNVTAAIRGTNNISTPSQTLTAGGTTIAGGFLFAIRKR